MNLENARKTLLEFKEILDQTNIKFWLTCGVLLGAVRDGDFIPYDKDIDLMTPFGNWNPAVIPKLEAAKFKPHFAKDTIYMNKRSIPIHILLYNYFAPLDIFVYPRKCHDPRWCEIPRNLLEEKNFVQFLGKKFRIPCAPKKLLNLMYGNTWKIPRKGDDWQAERTFQPIARKKIIFWIKKHPKEARKGING